MTLVAVAEKAPQGHGGNLADAPGYVVEQEIVGTHEEVVVKREERTELHI